MGSAYSKRKLVLVHPLAAAGAAGLRQDDDGGDVDDDPALVAASAICISPSVQSRFTVVTEEAEWQQSLKTESWARQAPRGRQQPLELFSPHAAHAAPAARPLSTNRVSPFGSQSDGPGTPGAVALGDQEATAASAAAAARSGPDQEFVDVRAAATMMVIDADTAVLPSPPLHLAAARVVPPVDVSGGKGDGVQQHTNPASKPTDLQALLAGLGERAIAGALPGTPHVQTEADTTAQMREHLRLAAELREQLQADGRRRERLSAGRGALQRCYAAHPADPLACGELVRAFAATVDASLRPHPPRAPMRTTAPY